MSENLCSIEPSHAACHLTGVQDGWTALMSAAYDGHLSCVKVLLENHADINLQNHVRTQRKHQIRLRFVDMCARMHVSLHIGW